MTAASAIPALPRLTTRASGVLVAATILAASVGATAQQTTTRPLKIALDGD